MGKVKSDGNSTAAARAALEEINREIDRSAAVIAEAARSMQLPDLLSGGEVAVDDTLPSAVTESISQAWTSACETLAIHIAAVAARLDEAMASLEEKPKPTLKERAHALLEDVLALRWRWRRSSRRPMDVLLAGLAEVDSLYGTLVARRQWLSETRRSVESNLVELGGHRARLAGDLVKVASQGGRDISGAAVLVEGYLHTVENFLVELNRQSAVLNVLVNKLAIEAERGILLAGILSPRQADPTAARLLEAQSVPHLASLLELHAHDMLSSVEVERRRTKIDGRFSETFQSALDKRPVTS